MSLFVKGKGENRKVTVKGNKKPCLIYCVGDSITAGANTWVNFVKINAQSAAPVDATVVNVGVGGQGLLYFQTNLQTQVLQFNPDIIIISTLLNDLYDNDQTRMTDYINSCFAHTNPNGKAPLVLGMTDNPTASDQDSTRPLALQDTTHTQLMNAYNSFPVVSCDNYAAWIALGRDSAEFLSMTDDHIHPNAKGQAFIGKTMHPAIDAIITKFYNG